MNYRINFSMLLQRCCTLSLNCRSSYKLWNYSDDSNSPCRVYSCNWKMPWCHSNRSFSFSEQKQALQQLHFITRLPSRTRSSALPRNCTSPMSVRNRDSSFDCRVSILAHWLRQCISEVRWSSKRCLQNMVLRNQLLAEALATSPFLAGPSFSNLLQRKNPPVSFECFSQDSVQSQQYWCLHMLQVMWLQPRNFSVIVPHLGQGLALALIHERFELSLSMVRFQSANCLQEAGRWSSLLHREQKLLPQRHCRKPAPPSTFTKQSQSVLEHAISCLLERMQFRHTPRFIFFSRAYPPACSPTSSSSSRPQPSSGQSARPSPRPTLCSMCLARQSLQKGWQARTPCRADSQQMGQVCPGEMTAPLICCAVTVSYFRSSSRDSSFSWFQDTLLRRTRSSPFSRQNFSWRSSSRSSISRQTSGRARTVGWGPSGSSQKQSSYIKMKELDHQFLQLHYLRIQDLESSPIVLDFASEFREIVEEKAVLLYQARHTESTVELDRLLRLGLQNDLFKSCFYFVMLKKFPFVFAFPVEAQIQRQEDRIRLLYARLFVAGQKHKSKVAGQLVFIHSFLVFRKLYKVFASQRSKIDQRLKFDICHYLTFVVLGVEISDSYTRRSLDSIFADFDLVSKKEKEIEEARRKHEQAAQEHRKRFFIVQENQRVEMRSPEQKAFACELSQLGGRNFTFREPGPARTPLPPISHRSGVLHFDTSGISRSLQSFLKYKEPQLPFQKQHVLQFQKEKGEKKADHSEAIQGLGNFILFENILGEGKAKEVTDIQHWKHTLVQMKQNYAPEMISFRPMVPTQEREFSRQDTPSQPDIETKDKDKAEEEPEVQTKPKNQKGKRGTLLLFQDKFLPAYPEQGESARSNPKLQDLPATNLGPAQRKPAPVKPEEKVRHLRSLKNLLGNKQNSLGVGGEARDRVRRA